VKSYTYQNGSDFRTITETVVSGIIEDENRSPQEKANAEKVLALELDASYTTSGGATFTRIADDSPPLVV
jgi:hypothetical protein